MLKQTIQGIAIAAITLFISVQGAFAALMPPHHKALLNERFGFGASMLPGLGVNTTGGAGASPDHIVTNDWDSGPGSLREAVSGDTPRWITFSANFDIHLDSPIEVGTYKTIDARGRTIRIYDHGLVIRTRNVILENLIIKEGTDDGVKILQGAGNIWIDHCSFNDWDDEAVSIIEPVVGIFTDVTVSWCKFTNMNHSMLIGHTPGDDEGSNMRVTIHHTWFANNHSRQPRIRRALVHVYNNLLENWEHYGMASVDFAQLRTQNNIFDAGSDEDAVIHETPGEGDEEGFVNCGYDWEIDSAVCRENEPDEVFSPAAFYSYTLDTNYLALRFAIVTQAGATR